MDTEKITRQESSAMRGIAILAIVLHNYCHWLPMVQENEYTFSEHNVRRLMMELAHPSMEIFAQLLSFFGHYGVPVFVFLSAYGLVRKYEDAKPDCSVPASCGAWDFISSHYKKLFMMMIVGYASFVFVDYITPGHRHYEFWNVIGQIGMFSNFYVDPDHDIWPGPYWYFGLMVQIYVVYRLVLYPGKGSLMSIMNKKQTTYMMWALLVVTILLQLVFEPEGLALQWYRYNVFGSLGVFIAGLYFTRSTRIHELSRANYVMVCFVSILLTFFFSMYEITWILVPFLICSGTISLVKILPRRILACMAWMGSISAFMFVCHPIARKVIIPISRGGELYAGIVLYVLVTFLLAILFKHIIAIVSREVSK